MFQMINTGHAATRQTTLCTMVESINDKG